MKKLLYFLLLVIIPSALNSQVVTEKVIAKFENLSSADPYSFSLDEKSGTFLYLNYDSTKTPNFMLYSNKGNSDLYDYIDHYSAVYDAQGNYFVTANKKINDSTYTYYLLRNGKAEFQCDFINNQIEHKNGFIYFLCTDKGKSFVGKYDASSGTFSKGKEYDEIILCYYDKIPYEGEPIGKFGFNKSGKPYFVAKSDGSAFVVVGDDEQKHYADIETYNFITDKNGNFAYVAKDTGSFMNAGGAFVVYGNKQYKSFYYIYNIVFDSKGNLYYIGTDESTDLSPQRIMCGDKVMSKTYSGGIYNLGLTSDDILYFIASEKKKNSEEYESFLVVDGKESKRYQSVINVKETPEKELLYTATIDENKSVIVKGDDENIIKQNSILSAEILKDGSLAYVTVRYGNYEKKIKDKFYVNIDGKTSGSYDGMQAVNYSYQDYFVSDKKGNYAYVINNITNSDEYYSAINWNGSLSENFDFLQDVFMYKGKPIYTGAKTVNKENYLNKFRIYFGNKPVTKEYDGVNNFKFDEKTGTASFAVVKGNELIKVEIKF